MRAASLLHLLALIAAVSVGRAATPPDEIVVKVNAAPILHREVVAEADAQIDANIVRDAKHGMIFDESARENLRAVLREDVLNTLIERLLIAQQLTTDHLEITNEEVDAEFQRRVASMHQTLAEAEKEIAEQGKTLALVKERLRWHTIGIAKLYEKHATAKKSLSEEEARHHYTEYPREFDRPEQRRVSHILVRANRDDDEKTRQAAREKASALLARIRHGENFATLARHHSDDDASKPRGGDRGFSTRGVVFRPDDDPFGQAAFTLSKIGDLSDLVETNDGFHIILLTELKPTHHLPWEEARDLLVADFRHREIGNFWEQYGENLKTTAKIEWLPGELTRQAETKRRQEKTNQQVEEMITREQTKKP